MFKNKAVTNLVPQDVNCCPSLAAGKAVAQLFAVFPHSSRGFSALPELSVVSIQEKKTHLELQFCLNKQQKIKREAEDSLQGLWMKQF